jgi:hypothetical protein
VIPVVDPATGSITPLATGLPPVYQLAVRPTPDARRRTADGGRRAAGGGRRAAGGGRRAAGGGARMLEA